MSYPSICPPSASPSVYMGVHHGTPTPMRCVPGDVHHHRIMMRHGGARVEGFMTDTAAGSEALAIEYRTVGGLKPDPRNARTHPRRQLEQIKASIQESASPTQS